MSRMCAHALLIPLIDLATPPVSHSSQPRCPRAGTFRVPVPLGSQKNVHVLPVERQAFVSVPPKAWKRPLNPSRVVFECKHRRGAAESKQKRKALLRLHPPVYPLARLPGQAVNQETKTASARVHGAMNNQRHTYAH